MFVAGRSVLNLKTAENAPIHLGIDTGASRSSISERVMSSITDKNEAKELISIASIGGTKQVEARHLENQEFSMGEGKRLHFDKMRVEPNFDEWAVFFKIDGVLGSDVVRNSCIHIDCLNGIVEIVD